MYPEVESVSAKLEPGNLNCPVSNNSCIVNITKDDNYTVNVTSNNAIDSTTYQDSFECELYCMMQYQGSCTPNARQVN